MRNSTLQLIIFPLLIIGLFIVGCGLLGKGAKPASVAKLDSFANYKTWPVIDYTIAPNPALGAAHMGNNPDYSRRIYINPTGKFAGEEFAVGTIHVKETFTWEDGKQKFADMGGVLAMVKRGGDFNPEGRGWEWFELASDLSKIKGQGGAEMMNGMCNSCHTQTTAQGGNDFVFPHPAEYEAKEADFADYKTWTVIGASAEPHPKLGPAHKGTEGLRRVYKKQKLANPDTAAGYPTGTILLKEVVQDGAVKEITVMVKRGSSFNPEHGAWEWFMLKPDTLAIAGRGADLMNGMCNSCHEAAKEAEFGKDYVFKHPDDPFNK